MLFANPFNPSDLALQILEESLYIEKPDHEILSPPLSPGSRTLCIERECTRRCFWLIQCMGWINGIYTYRPLRPRSVEMMRQVRLPSDETSFELVVPVQISGDYHLSLHSNGELPIATFH